jgi:hypothetical protein
MNQAVLSDTPLSADGTEIKRERRPLMFSAFVAVLAVVSCAVLVVDGSTTTEQRIAPFVQSGVFP